MDYENMSNQYNKILKEQENSIKILSSTIMRERGDDVEIGHSLYLNVPNESILDEKIKIILQKQDEIEIENKKLMNTIKKMKDSFTAKSKTFKKKMHKQLEKNMMKF